MLLSEQLRSLSWRRKDVPWASKESLSISPKRIPPALLRPLIGWWVKMSMGPVERTWAKGEKKLWSDSVLFVLLQEEAWSPDLLHPILHGVKVVPITYENNFFSLLRRAEYTVQNINKSALFRANIPYNENYNVVVPASLLLFIVYSNEIFYSIRMIIVIFVYLSGNVTSGLSM